MRFVINPFTDKLDVASLTGSGAPVVETVTGNSGGAVGPDPITFNLNLLGDNATGLNIVGNPATFTLTVFGLASSTSQVGTTRYATNSEAAAQSSGTVALTPSNITSFFSTNYLPSSQGGTGLSSPAAHQLIVSAGTSPYVPLGVASNGQIPIGSIASDPVLATLTAGGGISITNGPGSITIATSGSGTINTLTGNSGGAISPTAGNINTLGTGSITIAGSGSTLTTQLTGLTNHAVQVGAGTATLTQIVATANTGAVLQNNSGADPSYSTATYPSTTTVSQILYSSATNVVSGLATANRAVLTTGATGVPVLTALATDGQLIIGSTAGAPAAATLTAGTGITITPGSNSITIATSGTSTLNTLTGNSGGAISPTAGNINTVGTGSITIAGSSSTLTTQLTGLTNHNVQVGAGTATLTQVPPSVTSGIPLVSNGSSSDPSFTTAVVAGGGTGATSFTAHSLLLGQSTSPITALGAATNGQLPIGSTGADPTLSTLTAGTGITITNGAGSITIAATGAGFTWTNVTGATQTIAAENGYLSNNAGTVTFSLPASGTIGDVFRIVGVQGAWTITQAAGQQIKYGSSATTVGVTGALSSTDAGDCVECVATNTSASTVWRAMSSIGNLTVA